MKPADRIFLIVLISATISTLAVLMFKPEKPQPTPAPCYEVLKFNDTGWLIIRDGCKAYQIDSNGQGFMPAEG